MEVYVGRVPESGRLSANATTSRRRHSRGDRHCCSIVWVVDRAERALGSSTELAAAGLLLGYRLFDSAASVTWGFFPSKR